MKLINIVFFLIGLLVVNGCRNHSGTVSSTSEMVEKMDGASEAIDDSLKKANALQLQAQIKRVVLPAAQTLPVAQSTDEDAADDPAIWYNVNNPEESRILGTDKKAGLALYNLDGQLVDFKAVGCINNVDIRYNFQLGNERIDVAAASNRTDNSIVLFRIYPDSLEIINSKPALLNTSLIDDAYGCCMFRSPRDKHYYVFVGGKNGYIQQWQLYPEGNKIGLFPVRNIHVSSQSEGMAADDETGMLYVAEEGRGIWKMSAEADEGNHKQLIAYSDSLNPNIVYDLEGLDIYYAPGGKGYLIASSQGNFSYAVFQREGNNSYLGSFVINDTDTIDGVEETDGLCVTNLSLGSKYPNGLMVVQDGFNTEEGAPVPQNFKLVDWSGVANAFNDPLVIAPDYKDWMSN
ncbi:phytase [Marinilabiliaceae bacterium JC017]|nr:phytase [Marinilabiliaceae bacterium JC017]